MNFFYLGKTFQENVYSVSLARPRKTFNRNNTYNSNFDRSNSTNSNNANSNNNNPNSFNAISSAMSSPSTNGNLLFIENILMEI